MNQKTSLLAVSALVLCTAIEPLSAQTISISTETKSIEVAPSTVVQGYSATFDLVSLELQIRNRGSSTSLSEQCSSFQDFLESEAIAVSVAKQFQPVNPLPELVISYRPVTPGWSGPWQNAFASFPLPSSSRLLVASDDWRPEVVVAGLSAAYIGDGDADLNEEFEDFFKTVNEKLYDQVGRFRGSGPVIFKLDSLLVACALYNGEFDFSYRVAVKGPNLVESVQALEGLIDQKTIIRVQKALQRDNVPSGTVDSDLELFIFSRTLEDIARRGLDVKSNELPLLRSFTDNWSDTLSQSFRELTNAETSQLLSFLNRETVIPIFLEDEGSTDLDIVED